LRSDIVDSILAKYSGAELTIKNFLEEKAARFLCLEHLAGDHGLQTQFHAILLPNLLSKVASGILRPISAETKLDHLFL